jgi:hypothetical protein
LILLGLVIFAIFAYRHRGESREPNYRVFFVMGITWLSIGIVTDNSGLWAMGLVFLIIGLANRDKWKDEKKWSDLSPNERNIRLAVVGGLTLLLVVGVVAMLLTRGG